MKTNVDVITPVAPNDIEFLQKAADSVAQQQVPVTQYIIGPGTDRLQQYTKDIDHIELLDRPGLSVSEARNAGIEASNAPIIQFLDADDYLKPEHLTQVQDALTDVDLYWTDMKLAGTEREFKKLPDPAPPAPFFRKFLAVPLSALALRRDALNGTRFRPNIELGEGIDFVTRLLQDAKAVRSEEPSVVKGVRNGSLSVSMPLITRLRYQTRTALGIARALPACRPVLPGVLGKIFYRAIRDISHKIINR